MPFFALRRASEPDAALVAVVRAELPRVERLLARMLGPRVDLEDLVQNVFLEALRALPRYRGEGSHGAFIGGVAVRVARRAMRGSAFSRRRAELPGELPSAAIQPEEACTQRAWIVSVRRALLRLPANKRIAFTLWALEGIEIAEIAAMTGASVAATRSRIFYAQQKLKQIAARDPVLREALGESS